MSKTILPNPNLELYSLDISRATAIFSAA